MSFNQIKDLRKNGHLQEAYNLAHSELTTFPDDIWIKRALMWVLYDLMKEKKDISSLLKEVVELNLKPDEESMFFDNLLWVVGKNISEYKNTETEYLDQVFGHLSKFRFSSSQGYSFLLKSFLKHKSKWGGLLDFFDWWGLENLRDEDYQPFRMKEGGEIMSLAEQSYIAYAKLLLQSDNNDKIRNFLPKIDKIRSQYTKYVYPPYYVAKLYHKIGENDKAKLVLLPFIRKQSKDYWVWQILGDVSTDEDLKFSCYSKALTCKCKPEMLVSIKVEYAKMLINRSLYNEAKTEISQVIKIRENNSWSTSSLRQYETYDWYKNSSILANNTECYKKYLGAADELMLDDLIHLSFTVVGINNEKKIVNFITSDRKKGMFICPRQLKLSVGNCYEGYFSEYEDNGFARAVRVSPSNNPIWNTLKQTFTGVLRIVSEKRFGIVECDNMQVFVPKTLINGFDDLDKVSVTAVASYDNTKKKEGWTAFIINKQ